MMVTDKKHPKYRKFNKVCQHIKQIVQESDKKENKTRIYLK